MKIYAIYRTDLGESVLYAITDNKELLDEFMSIRDSNRFIVGTTKTTRHNGLKFLDDHSYSLLTRTSFKTNGEFGINSVDMVVTRAEEETILLKGEEILIQELSKYIIDGEIFNIELQRELYNLDYFKIFKFIHCDRYINMPYYSGISEVEADIYSLRCDELMIFIHKFGWSISPKKLKIRKERDKL